MDEMDHNAHSVYLMYYHLVMVVKYRRKVIDDPISERAKEIWEHIYQCIQKCKQPSAKKGISADQGKNLEGSILEPEFLPVDSRWCTD